MAVRKINIDESEISVIFGLHADDYICLTDMVKAGDNSERTNIAMQNTRNQIVRFTPPTYE